MYSFSEIITEIIFLIGVIKDILKQSQLEIVNTEFIKDELEVLISDFFLDESTFPNIKKSKRGRKRADPKPKDIKVKKIPMKKNSKKTGNKIEQVKISIKHERINYCSPGLTNFFNINTCPTYLKKYLKKNEQIKKPKKYQKKGKLSVSSNSPGSAKTLKNNVPIVLSIKGNSPNVLNGSVVNPEYLYKSVILLFFMDFIHYT